MQYRKNLSSSLSLMKYTAELGYYTLTQRRYRRSALQPLPQSFYLSLLLFTSPDCVLLKFVHRFRLTHSLKQKLKQVGQRARGTEGHLSIQFVQQWKQLRVMYKYILYLGYSFCCQSRGSLLLHGSNCTFLFKIYLWTLMQHYIVYALKKIKEKRNQRKNLINLVYMSHTVFNKSRS